MCIRLAKLCAPRPKHEHLLFSFLCAFSSFVCCFFILCCRSLHFNLYTVDICFDFLNHNHLYWVVSDKPKLENTARHTWIKKMEQLKHRRTTETCFAVSRTFTCWHLIVPWWCMIIYSLFTIECGLWIVVFFFLSYAWQLVAVFNH